MEISLKTADKTEATATDTLHEPNPSPEYHLKFIKLNGRYRLLLHGHHRYQLRNSLLAAVGFFELANAGDFAANVWNEIPVPPYAIALMAVGGTLALSMTYFAYRDARRSWHNLQSLRCERRYLLRTLKEEQQQQQQSDQRKEVIHTTNALLGVNFREMGTEIIDRIGMDISMGFGAAVVGVGTLMAIDGANHSVWFASNLLSGYIGNVPLAIYGLVNLIWSAYVWIRARRHGICYGATKRLTQTDTDHTDDTVGKLLKARIDAVQLHAALNGITGVVAGAASLVTAIMWWGYVVLVPCIILSVIVNYLWRHGLGYDRPLVVQILPSFDVVSLTEELKYVASIQRVFHFSSKKKKWSKKSSPPVESPLFSGVVSHPESMASILEFMMKNELLEDFCIRLLNDEELATAALLDLTGTTVIIRPYELSNVKDESVRSRLIEMARGCINDLGPIHCKYRDRYLLEILGCYMTASATKSITVENTGEEMV